MFGPKPIIEEALTKSGFTVHKAFAAPDKEAFLSKAAPLLDSFSRDPEVGPIVQRIRSQ